MLENALVRITLPYDEIRAIIACWAQSCEKIACYEHVGTKTEKTHCHLLMYNMAITWDAMKKKAQRQFPSVDLKGNGNMAKASKYQYDAYATIRYLIKGDKNYEKGRSKECYIKGYEPEFLEECYLSWKEEVVEPKKTRLQVIMEGFTSYVYDKGHIYSDLDLDKCQELAGKYIYEYNGGVWHHPQSMNDVKSIVYSAHFDEECRVVVPRGYTQW